jgi:hypothetical protein
VARALAVASGAGAADRPHALVTLTLDTFHFVHLDDPAVLAGLAPTLRHLGVRTRSPAAPIDWARRLALLGEDLPLFESLAIEAPHCRAVHAAMVSTGDGHGIVAAAVRKHLRRVRAFDVGVGLGRWRRGTCPGVAAMAERPQAPP